MRHVAEKTGIPVPRVLSYFTGSESAAAVAGGREYVLMERCPGVQLQRVWPSLDRGARVAVVARLARLLAELRGSAGPFALGGSFGDNATEAGSAPLSVGCFVDTGAPPVSTYSEFYAQQVRHYQPCLRRDPLFVMLAPALEQWCVRELPRLCCEDGCEAAPTPRQFVLTHSDLNGSNVLVDSRTLEITGVVDWEWAGASPPTEDVNNVLYDLLRDPTEDACVRAAFERALLTEGIDCCSALARGCTRAQHVTGLVIAACCYLDWDDPATPEPPFALETKARLETILRDCRLL
eukprot:TRINITY_DN4075_c0_g1_i1.p1 TRINITY_DN4075_c0_g1~~TRINITY_DN4075_c0_g1_i1.p1  ORF type:complete len:293 (-),score=64.73 TRINITY_DN4075_c0_g1_i1:48-926(-)